MPSVPTSAQPLYFNYEIIAFVLTKFVSLIP